MKKRELAQSIFKSAIESPKDEVIAKKLKYQRSDSQFSNDDDRSRPLPVPPAQSSRVQDSTKFYEYTLQSFNYINESSSGGVHNSTSHFNQEDRRLNSHKGSMHSL